MAVLPPIQDDTEDPFAFLKDIPDEEFVSGAPDASAETADVEVEPEAEQAAPAEASEEDKPKRRPGKLERKNARLERELAEMREQLKAERNRASGAEQNHVQAHTIAINAAKAELAARRQMALAEQAAAFRNGDDAAHAAASDALMQITVRERELANIQPPQPTPQRQANGDGYSETAKEWIEANPWFLTDKTKQNLAKSLHGAAAAAGLEIDSPAYYDFIGAGIEKVYPGTVNRLDDDEDEPAAAPAAPAAKPKAPARTVAAAAPVTRTVSTPQAAASANRALPKLTREQASIADAMGITYKDYAIELMKAQKNNQLSAQKYR